MYIPSVMNRCHYLHMQALFAHAYIIIQQRVWVGYHVSKTSCITACYLSLMLDMVMDDGLTTHAFLLKYKVV